MSSPANHRFSGVRLGRRERTILKEAPLSSALAGLPIDAPEKTRTAQEAYLRAARKLEDQGLVFRAAVPYAVRVNDPRRHHPMYRNGRFWVRPDTTRRHLVNRIYVWITPLGDGVRTVYKGELLRGDAIRWTQERIAMVEYYARLYPSNPHQLQQAVAHLRSRASENADEAEGRYTEFVPDVVDGPGDHREWLIAVATARRWKPALGAEKLLEVALREYERPQAPKGIREMARSRVELAEMRASAPMLSHRPLSTPFS